MNPIRNFEEFLQGSVVKRQRPDFSRASSLKKEAENRLAFLHEMVKKIGVSDRNANYFVESAYDTIMELIRAHMFIAGYKATGLSAHEAEVSYLRSMDFSESFVRFVNDLRYSRNGIVYYGRNVDAEYANKVLDFLKTNYPKLRQI